MTDKTIDELDPSTPLSGTEELPIWQTGTTRKALLQDIVDLASSGNVLSVNAQTGNVVLTASDVDAVPTGQGLPAGGITGQYLKKECADDYCVEWGTLAAVAASGNYNDLFNRPSLSAVAISNDYNDLSNRPSLALVATSGNYNDLSNRPSLASVATSGNYNDLSNRPSLALVATSGDYNDLLNTPTLALVATSGDYNDLLNLPALGTAAFDNTSDFATALQGSKADSAEQSANKSQPNGYASLDGGGKIPSTQLPNSVMEFQGEWDASTNTPTLANGTGNPGDVYEVSAAGTVDFGAGSISFAINDFVVYGALGKWQKSLNSNSVDSVNGYTGIVVLTNSDVGLGNVTNDAQLKRASGDIDSFTAKATPINADELLIEDSAASFAKKKVTLGTLPYPVTSVAAKTGAVTLVSSDVGLGNVTNDAQLKRASGDIDSFTAKATPINADELLIEDSAASFAKKKVTLGTLPYPVTSVVAKTGAVTLVSSDVGLGNVTNDAQLKRASGDIDSFTAKATPINADELLIEDSAASFAKKKVTLGTLPYPVTSVAAKTGAVTLVSSDVGLGNVTNDAQLKRASGDIDSFTAKATPINADELLIEDSAASFAKKKVTLGTLPYPVTSVAAKTGAVTLVSSDVGLGNVTNDAQLKRSANDFNSFTHKSTPVGGDILLMEDSAASGVKKYLTVSDLAGQALWNSNKLQGKDIITTAPTDGQLLTYVAADSKWEPKDASVVTGGTWTDWTPTLGAESGTYSSTTINAAKYLQIGKTVYFVIDVTGTTASGATGLTFTLPVTPITGVTFGFGGHILDASNNFGIGGQLDSSGTATARKSTGTNIGNGSGRTLNATGFYIVP